MGKVKLHLALLKVINGYWNFNRRNHKCRKWGKTSTYSHN